MVDETSAWHASSKVADGILRVTTLELERTPRPYVDPVGATKIARRSWSATQRQEEITEHQYHKILHVKAADSSVRGTAGSTADNLDNVVTRMTNRSHGSVMPV